MKKFLAIALALGLTAGFSAVYAAEDLKVTISEESTTKHWDPTHPGHSHQAPDGSTYHQTGDMYPNSPATGGQVTPPMPPTPPIPPMPPINPNHPNGPGPNGPGPNNPNNPNDPNSPNYDYHNDPNYRAGYQQGYNEGYRQEYQNGFNIGLSQGENEGRRNGESEGYSKFISRFQNYTYTQEKLADLINKLNFPTGVRALAVDLGTASGAKSDSRMPNYFSTGYNDGLMNGRNTGRNEGIRDGSRKTYPAAYQAGFQEGQRKGDMVIHYNNGNHMLSIEEQFATGLDALNRGDYTTALLRFNIVMIEEAVGVPNGFRNKAFWYAGHTFMKKGDYETSLAIFIIHYLNNPETMKEDTVLNIASMLLEVKTGGFIGIGAKKYYDKSMDMLNFWVANFPRSQRLPEAFFKQGECFEKMKNKDAAKAAYQKVVDSFPNTSIAEDAKKRIKKLNSFWGSF